MASKSTSILDLSRAPEDPVERVFWLSGVLAKAEGELTEALADAYFEARLQGRFESALRCGPVSRTRALKMTRRVNEQSGRSVRWADRLDPTSRYSEQ